MRKLVCVAALLGGSLLPLARKPNDRLSLSGGILLTITGTSTVDAGTITATYIAAVGTIANR